MEQLFVYGTLCQPAVVKKIIGRAVFGIPATLRGYRKKSVSYYDGNCFVVITDRGSSVKGEILFVTKQELQLFDEHEYRIYVRKRVRLTNSQKAWTYVLRYENQFS